MIMTDFVLLIAPVATLILTVVVLSYYFQRLKEVGNKNLEASEIVRNIITEIRSRMNNQDKKIMDQEVKLEILELRIARLLQQSEKELSIKLERRGINRKIQRERSRNKILTDTEKTILMYLTERDYTATELQSLIEKTREHTARMLKKLFQAGYIERDERKRPYVYRLIEKETSTSE